MAFAGATTWRRATECAISLNTAAQALIVAPTSKSHSPAAPTVLESQHAGHLRAGLAPGRTSVSWTTAFWRSAQRRSRSGKALSCPQSDSPPRVTPSCATGVPLTASPWPRSSAAWWNASSTSRRNAPRDQRGALGRTRRPPQRLAPALVCRHAHRRVGRRRADSVVRPGADRTPADAARLLADYTGPWWVAEGWAIEAFTGVSRNHGYDHECHKTTPTARLTTCCHRAEL